MEVAIEDSQFDEPLEMIAKFEDKCLKPLRVAKCKDINMKKMTEVVDWAKLVDKLSSRMDSTFMKQTDRLFLALIDNPRLTSETLLKYVPLCADHVISTGREMTNLVSNFECLFLFFFSRH